MSGAKKSPDAAVAACVSNTDRDIYTVANLPEEVIAVIFAYVSRSPKSFRENIAKVLREEGRGEQRAAEFHEKWVLNYGHASVAEHASVHLGIERVSRLFSSMLELCGEHLSFTEYSQRYQRPKKSDFVVPPEITGALARQFSAVCEKQYEIYEKLFAALFEYLKKQDASGNEKTFEKIAFEDARYALNLSAMTNLAMTANARAVEDALAKLLSSRSPEARMRAEEIKREVRFSVPTLVKYARENPHIIRARENLGGFFGEIKRRKTSQNLPPVRLIDWTGRETGDAQKFALRKICSALACENGFGASEVDKFAPDALEEIFALATENLGGHDNPHDALKTVSYTAEFVISEACWHQLLRHRKSEWFACEPCVSFGATVPPNIKSAGAAPLLGDAVALGEGMYENLREAGFPQAAPYAVTNAHNRRVAGNFSLWEVFHLVNLRMSPGAQWDIKNTVKALVSEIEKVHPLLIRPALERVTERA